MAIHAREAHLPTLDEHRRREIGNELQATLNGGGHGSGGAGVGPHRVSDMMMSLVFPACS